MIIGMSQIEFSDASLSLLQAYVAIQAFWLQYFIPS